MTLGWTPSGAGMSGRSRAEWLAAIGRTLYGDMRRMESIVQVGELDWMIMRPLGLADIDPPTTYAIAEDTTSAVAKPHDATWPPRSTTSSGEPITTRKWWRSRLRTKGRAYLRPSGEKPSSRDFGSATEQAEQAGSVPRKLSASRRIRADTRHGVLRQPHVYERDSSITLGAARKRFGPPAPRRRVGCRVSAAECPHPGP